MEENKLIWCLSQKKGISIIEIKNHLSEDYIKEADETLESMLKISGKWKLITAYYSCYNALYSILMKCGVSSEIHSCSIKLMDFFDFSVKEKEFLTDLKDKRIQSQYYLKSITFSKEKEVKDFILKCKVINNQLSEIKITKIRKDLENKLKGVKK
jgi:uncharacterized protein (UPF0332 family)